MERNKKRIGIIVLTLLISLLVSTVFAFANEYDYNDINLRVNGSSVGWYVFSSDSLISGTTYLDVSLSTANSVLITPQGGDTINTGIYVSGIYELTVNQYNNSGITISYTNGVYRISGVTTVGLYDITINITASQSQLTTPTVSYQNNIFTWNAIPNAVGYNVQFSTDSNQWTNIANNYKYNQYSVSQTGYYRVRALSDTDIYNSEFSVVVYCTYQYATGDTGSDSSGSGGVLQWLISRLSNFTESLNTFFSNISSLIGQVGLVFTSFTSFLPEAYAGMLWSIAAVMLMFGLFRLF